MDMEYLKSEVIDPATGKPVEMGLSDEILKYGFEVFVVLKTLGFDYALIRYIMRYYQTYKSCGEVEIWLMVLTAIKVTILMPDYFLQEINYLFVVFVINSATTFWLSHVLHMRACIIQEKSLC